MNGEIIMKYVLAFTIVFLIVYLLIPHLKNFALKIDFVDKPTERKKHKVPVPHLGGVGIFIGFVCAYLIFIRPLDLKHIIILTSSLMVLTIGLVDDWYKTHGKEFSPLPRLIVQLSAAMFVYFAGVSFTGFTSPFSGDYILLPQWLQFILSITWIFGVTTVINFTDGMDGLAGGLTTISASTLFVVALAMSQEDSALMAIILVGAALSFLKYNRHPAQIYMGDSGATFLGFILGIIALDGAFKQATIMSLFIPILALGVPIFDNLFVVVKRFLDGKPIYKADTSQVHYRLLDTGLSQQQVVTLLYLVSICLSLVSIILLLLNI